MHERHCASGSRTASAAIIAVEIGGSLRASLFRMAGAEGLIEAPQGLRWKAGRLIDRECESVPRRWLRGGPTS